VRVQHLSCNHGPEASHFRTAPIELREFIELANVLPAPEALPGAEPVGKLPVREHWDDQDTDVPFLMQKFPHFRVFMRGLDVQDPGLRDPESIAGHYAPVFQRCRSLKEIRGVLYTIARFNHSKLREQIPIGGLIENSVSAHLDEDGRIRIEHSPLLRALDGIDVARIRECSIDHKIFWASRVDQTCCTTRCAKVRRTRRWRQRYLDKYKQQRIAKTEQTGLSENEAVQYKRDRKELETLTARNSSRRAPRLPSPPK
jgi:hypothetical protein